jgi:hypothetical protein
MWCSTWFARCWRVLSLVLALLSPASLFAQHTLPSKVQVAAGAGYTTAGAYFAGPGGLELSGQDAFAGTLQVSVPVQRSFAVVVAGTYMEPDLRLSGLPLIGSVGLRGGRIWFVDVSVRGVLPLGAAGSVPTAFAQVGAGLGHYSVSSSVLGESIDEAASNFAASLGVGVGFPLMPRFGIELMTKDYIASFKSVQDLAGFDVEGRRTHTLLLSASARISL